MGEEVPDQLPRNKCTAKEWREAFYVTGREGKCEQCADTGFTNWPGGREAACGPDTRAAGNGCAVKEQAKRGCWSCAKCGHELDRRTSFTEWLKHRTDKRRNDDNTE